MVPGAYRLRDYRYAITAVLTNKLPGRALPRADADL